MITFSSDIKFKEWMEIFGLQFCKSLKWTKYKFSYQIHELIYLINNKEIIVSTNKVIK